MSADYTWWGELPAHLRTKTQLADLDLPRIPGAGPVEAIRARGPHGRKDTFDLYDITASLPSPASAKQLEAARAKQDPVLRRCAACGAHPDYPPTLHRDPEQGGRAVLLCRACLHVARLRAYQQRLAAEREQAAHLAASWLANDNAAVVHLTVITPPKGENSRAKRPVALLVDVVVPSGAQLARMPIRLARSRNPLVPDGAVDEAEAVPQLREIVAARDVVTWSAGALTPIESVFSGPAAPYRRRELTALDRKVAAWRGELDPLTRTLITPLDPGRADLMALLIRRMATDHAPAEHGGPQ